MNTSFSMTNENKKKRNVLLSNLDNVKFRNNFQLFKEKLM